MNRYLVEMRYSGAIEGSTITAYNEQDAIRQAQERYPGSTFYRIKLLG
jgi:hypothetical protein